MNRLSKLYMLCLVLLMLASCTNNSIKNKLVVDFPQNKDWDLTVQFEWDKKYLKDTIYLKYKGNDKVKEISIKPFYAKTFMPSGYTPPGRWNSTRTFDTPPFAFNETVTFTGNSNEPWKDVSELLSKEDAENLIKASSFEVTWVNTEGLEKKVIIKKNK